MTTFKSALGLCGLSQAQAARFLDCSLGNVKKWSSGTRDVPEFAWDMLAGLFDQVTAAADSAADVMERDGVPAGAKSSITADNTIEPLPEGADEAAGAMALLMHYSATRERSGFS